MAKRWLKGAIKKMKKSPGTKRAKALRKRLKSGEFSRKKGKK